LEPVPVKFISSSGERLAEIPGEEICVAFFPIYRDLPGVLTDAPLDVPLLQLGPYVYHDTQTIHDTMRRYARTGEDEWRIESFQIKSDVFARMIAKIAHAAAVHELGVDSFVHRLPGPVLGTDTRLGYYIGAGKPPGKQIAASGTNVMVPGKQLHSIDLILLRREGRTPLVMAEIGLFSFAGTPSYRAVVGEAGPEAEEILERGGR
jgi:hypothetical protein